MKEIVRNTKDKGFAVLLKVKNKFIVDYQPYNSKRIKKSIKKTFSTKVKAMKYFKAL